MWKNSLSKQANSNTPLIDTRDFFGSNLGTDSKSWNLEENGQIQQISNSNNFNS